MWNALRNLRRDADCGPVGEVIVVDHAQVDPLEMPPCDHRDCPLDIERYAKRAGKAVRGAEWQHRQRDIGRDQFVD